MSQNNVKLSRLATGNIYNLKTIFSGENDKIVIPDMQRDYCWGEKGLVANFLDTIIDMDKSQAITMGLLYGYVNPLSPEHIQLCDGQQRLTTLFLLIGMINKKLQGNPYQHLLISDFELNGDDKEPYLQYSIRESSLYFLSDLTYNFFLNKDNSYTVDEISNQPWFLNSYQLDPTIRNIIDALRTIDGKLNMESKKLAELGEFVTTKINFLYHDMGDRKNGEETFVVINTTGEPLTANQNLKPLFIKGNVNKNQNVAEDWEKMETWFWKNRVRNVGHTSDEGMAVFLHLLRILNDCTKLDDNEFKKLLDDGEGGFPYERISGEVVFKYHKAYIKFYDRCFAKEQKDLKTRRLDEKLIYSKGGHRFLYKTIPILQYCYKFYDEISEIDIDRMFHLFSTMYKYDYQDPHEKIRKYLKMVNSMGSRDIDILIDSEELHKEERRKLKILHSLSENRREYVEIMFASAEDSNIFRGRLSPILDWSGDDIEKFEFYFGKVSDFWGNGEKLAVSDNLRRVLLTYGLDNYPTKNRNTLGWGHEEWYQVFHDNPGMKDVIDEMAEIEVEYNFNNKFDVFQRVIDTYVEKHSNTPSVWFPIIKDPEILAKSSQKSVNVRENNILLVMNKAYRNAGFTIIFNTEVIPYDFIKDEWGVLNEYKGLLYADHFKFDLTIELAYDQGFMVFIWSGKHRGKQSFDHLEELGKRGFEWEDNRWRTSPDFDGKTALRKMKEIAQWVNSYM